jgi:hypothetical protein
MNHRSMPEHDDVRYVLFFLYSLTWKQKQNNQTFWKLATRIQGFDKNMIRDVFFIIFASYIWDCFSSRNNMSNNKRKQPSNTTRNNDDEECWGLYRELHKSRQQNFRYINCLNEFGSISHSANTSTSIYYPLWLSLLFAFVNS